MVEDQYGQVLPLGEDEARNQYDLYLVKFLAGSWQRRCNLCSIGQKN